MMFKWRKTTLMVSFRYLNNHLYSVNNFNPLKMRYIEPLNFLTKCALVSQPSILALVKDPNISHYLNSSIHLRLSLPFYNTHPPWLSLTNELKFVDWLHQINSLSLANLLLLINKISFICEGQWCRVRIAFNTINTLRSRKNGHDINLVLPGILWPQHLYVLYSYCFAPG